MRPSPCWLRSRGDVRVLVDYDCETHAVLGMKEVMDIDSRRIEFGEERITLTGTFTIVVKRHPDGDIGRITHGVIVHMRISSDMCKINSNLIHIEDD